jgi:hypothetical protein
VYFLLAVLFQVPRSRVDALFSCALYAKIVEPRFELRWNRRVSPNEN